MPLELQKSANIPAYSEDDRKEWLTTFPCNLNSAFFFFQYPKYEATDCIKAKSERIKHRHNPQKSVKWGAI